MTNKEAIEFIKNMIDREAIGFVVPEGDGDVAIWQYHVEALEMAITALENNSKKLEKDDFGTLAICAIRYCHGRQTYMPDLVRGIIRPRLKELSDKDLNVMIEDCDFQERMHLYGDERIDKSGWLRWREELIAERKRRTNESD